MPRAKDVLPTVNLSRTQSLWGNEGQGWNAWDLTRELRLSGNYRMARRVRSRARRAARYDDRAHLEGVD